MTMFERTTPRRSSEICSLSQELVQRSKILCRDSRDLIEASREILGDLDDFLAEFEVPEAANE